jgi:hypothetical protein
MKFYDHAEELKQHFNSFIHDFLFENSPLLEEGKTKRSDIMSILKRCQRNRRLFERPGRQ